LIVHSIITYIIFVRAISFEDIQFVSIGEDGREKGTGGQGRREESE